MPTADESDRKGSEVEPEPAAAPSPDGGEGDPAASVEVTSPPSTTPTPTPWPRLDVSDNEERIIRFRPAFHRCNPSPSKNYGISAVHMHWWLRVGDWAVGWDVFTGWDMPADEFKAANPDCTHRMHQNGPPASDLSAGAVDFHSPVPRWEGQELAQEHCPITDAPCYLDYGYLIAEDVLTILRVNGDEAVWTWMRKAIDQMRSEVDR